MKKSSKTVESAKAPNVFHAMCGMCRQIKPCKWIPGTPADDIDNFHVDSHLVCVECDAVINTIYIPKKA